MQRARRTRGMEGPEYARSIAGSILPTVNITIFAHRASHDFPIPDSKRMPDGTYVRVGTTSSKGKEALDSRGWE
jgi:hypothetical protein